MPCPFAASFSFQSGIIRHSVPQLFHHSSASHASSSISLQLFGQVECGGVSAWTEGSGRAEPSQSKGLCPAQTARARSALGLSSVGWPL